MHETLDFCAPVADFSGAALVVRDARVLDYTAELHWSEQFSGARSGGLDRGSGADLIWPSCLCGHWCLCHGLVEYADGLVSLGWLVSGLTVDLCLCLYHRGSDHAPVWALFAFRDHCLVIVHLLFIWQLGLFMPTRRDIWHPRDLVIWHIFWPRAFYLLSDLDNRIAGHVGDLQPDAFASRAGDSCSAPAGGHGRVFWH